MNHSSLSGLIRSGVLCFVCAAITLAGCSQPPSETPSEDPARDTESKNSTEISIHRLFRQAALIHWKHRKRSSLSWAKRVIACPTLIIRSIWRMPRN